MVVRKESEPQWEDFSSGTNWDNYVKSCLVAMQNNCDRALKTNAFHAAMTESAATTTIQTFHADNVCMEFNVIPTNSV